MNAGRLCARAVVGETGGVPQPEMGRAAQATLLLNGQVLVVGGYDGIPLASTVLYTPDATPHPPAF